MKKKKCLGEPLVPASLNDAPLSATTALNHDHEDVSEAESDVVCGETPVAFHLAAGNNPIAEIEITQDSRSSTVETLAPSSEAVGAADDSINALCDDYCRTFLYVVKTVPISTDAIVDVQNIDDGASQVHCHILSPSTGTCIVFQDTDSPPESTCAIALDALKDVKKIYRAIFAAAVEAKAAPGDPGASTSGILRELRRFYYAVFALAVKTKATPADAAKAALNAFSVVGEFCRGIFAASIKTKATLEDASNVARDAFNSINGVYYTVFSALATAGATLECATNAALDAFEVAIGIYHNIFVAAIRVKTAPIDAHTAAKAALVNAKKFHCAVFTAVSKAEATPADAANAALDVFNAGGKFYHDISAAAVSAKVLSEHVDATAAEALSDIEKFYYTVFTAAIEAKASPTDAALAARNASSIASKFYRTTYVAGLGIYNLPQCALGDAGRAFDAIAKIYCDAFAAAINAQVTSANATETALNALNVASELYHRVNTAATEAAIAPQDASCIALDALDRVNGLCHSLPNVVKVPITLLLIAKTIYAAADGFGAIYSGVLRDIHGVATDARRLACPGATLVCTHETKLSLQTNVDVVYQATLSNVHAAATLAGLDLFTVFSMAVGAAATLQTVYLSECRKVFTDTDLANMPATKLVNRALSAVASVCRAYENNLISAINRMAGASAANAPVVQVDDVVEQARNTSWSSTDHPVPPVPLAIDTGNL